MSSVEIPGFIILLTSNALAAKDPATLVFQKLP